LHVYGLLSVPGRVIGFLDGNPIHEENPPARLYQQDFFIVLGMPEGAKWKDGDPSGVTSPRVMLSVYWGRVWQKDREVSLATLCSAIWKLPLAMFGAQF
jgi:hypothetical protein